MKGTHRKVPTAVSRCSVVGDRHSKTMGYCWNVGTFRWVPFISPERRCLVECRTGSPGRLVIWPVNGGPMLPAHRVKLPQLRLSIWQAAWLRGLAPLP